jgi:hypothetical protein
MGYDRLNGKPRPGLERVDEGTRAEFAAAEEDALVERARRRRDYGREGGPDRDRRR